MRIFEKNKSYTNELIEGSTTINLEGNFARVYLLSQKPTQMPSDGYFDPLNLIFPIGYGRRMWDNFYEEVQNIEGTLENPTNLDFILFETSVPDSKSNVTVSLFIDLDRNNIKSSNEPPIRYMYVTGQRDGYQMCYSYLTDHEGKAYFAYTSSYSYNFYLTNREIFGTYSQSYLLSLEVGPPAEGYLPMDYMYKKATLVSSANNIYFGFYIY